MKYAAFLAGLVTLCSGQLARADDHSSDTVKSVAVLDFVNRNPADGRDWLGKGLADMVTTDLSASHRLTVVDRERVQDLAREMDLTAAGLVNPTTASRVGHVAKVRRVLFGTFSCRGQAIAIEAQMIDVTTQKSMRIDQVEGPLSSLFDLEQRLVRSILAKLDVPMTEEELRMVKLLKTQSLPAFEHYARCLGFVDEGRCFDGLREARLARRADPAYFASAMRLAQLYYDVGEPEHAMIEYRRFVEEDRRDKLPVEVYFMMGKILQQAFADRVGAIDVVQRLVGRDPQLEQPFRITDPSPPFRSFNELGGMSRVNALFDEHKSAMQALERIARWQLEAGEELDAAQRYGQLWCFLDTHGMSQISGDVPFVWLNVRQDYEPLYWHMVTTNRDATLYPPVGLHVLSAEGEVVGRETKPTHGWSYRPIWLAPPDREIAEASFALEDDGTKIPDVYKGKVTISFICKGYPWFKATQVKPDGMWHTLKFEPGIRALDTPVSFTNRWKIKFLLRPFSQHVPLMPKIGSLQLFAQPTAADLYVNGRRLTHATNVISFGLQPGRYAVEARWSNGRRRSAIVDLAPQQRATILLNCDVETLSRQVVTPDAGSNSYLFTDRNGRIWLLWDDICRGGVARADAESNLYSATSMDGTTWSRPRRLPMSLLDCDTMPILQQDRRGIFWLLWVSHRDPGAPTTPWIASSPNGIEWSFPRKLALPEAKKGESASWPNTTAIPRPAFAIDARNVFWLMWQGCLMRSEDAMHWQVDPKWLTRDTRAIGDVSDCHLFAATEGLLLVANPGPTLWRLDDGSRWRTLGSLMDSPRGTEHAGNAASLIDGTVVTVSQYSFRNSTEVGLCIREFTADGSKSMPLGFESAGNHPFHPSIASLHSGRILVAFGSKDGLVAAVLRKIEGQKPGKGGPL